MSVGADAERSCSRRRSVTDAACPLRVLIGPFLNPFFSFSARKKRTVSIFQEKKEGKVRTVVLNLTQKNLSHQLSVAFIPTARKVSALCASPFGTAAQQNERFRADEGIGPYKIYRRFSDFHTPQVQSKALVDRRGPGKPSERFPRSLFSFARHFLFGEAKRKCRPFPLFPKRERKEWVQKRVQPQFAALQKSPFFFLGTRHSGAGPSTRMISSPIRRMQHHGTT